MPAKSKKQKRLMQAAAHDPEFAKKAGVSQSVAREYVRKTPKRKAARKAK